MNRWHSGKLREFIKHNKSDKDLHIERIHSLNRVIEIYRYHMGLAKEANDAIAPKDMTEAMRLIFPSSEERHKELLYKKVVIQANTQAAVLYARSIHDIFAQLINGLLLAQPIPVHSCDINKVTNALSDSKLKTQLESLVCSDEYQYINAFINTIKHRNLVSFGSHVNLESEEGGVQFKSFNFKGTNHPSLWAEQVLKRSLTVKNTVISAGMLLNQELGIENAPKQI